MITSSSSIRSEFEIKDLEDRSQRVWCMGCNEPKENSISITKDRKTGFVCRQCHADTKKLDDILQVFPAALYAILERGWTVESFVAERSAAITAYTGGSRLTGKGRFGTGTGSAKWTCEKCKLTFAGKGERREHFQKMHSY